MLIEIEHVTRYGFTETANYSVQRLRLTPRPHDGQTIVRWAVETQGIETAARFRDSFGNEVHLVACAGSHDGVHVRAHGVIETRECHGIVAGLVEPAPTRVYLRTTAATAPDDAIRDLALAARGGDDIARAHDLMDRVRAAIAYEVGATHGATTAAEALAAGRGVCQDHAHVFIAAARSIGIPARYVTGYLGSAGSEPAEAHHAWAEAWLPPVGWIGFDVANRLCPTEEYVRLACGLDAGHAAPVRGTRRGGGDEELDVVVRVQQQCIQQ